VLHAAPLVRSEVREEMLLSQELRAALDLNVPIGTKCLLRVERCHGQSAAERMLKPGVKFQGATGAFDKRRAIQSISGVIRDISER
jgi:hypothetical protein